MPKEKQISFSGFRHLYPFKSNYLKIGGFRYHYLDEGKGNPIVMLHGNPTWSFYYRKMVKELSMEYRAIVPDHIGCGLSDKPDPNNYNYRLQNRVRDLETLIEFLDVKKKLTLVLHDWGGIIGAAYGLKYPERLNRLIIMNTAAFLPPGGKSLPIRLRIFRNHRLFAASTVLNLNLFVYGALFTASYRGLKKEVKRGLLAPYNSRKNRIAILKFIQDIPIKQTDPSYQQVKWIDNNLHKLKEIPMLICWGKHDFVFTAEYLTEWLRRFPSAEPHVFTDAGHYVLEDVPEKVIPLIKNVLERDFS
ncbi:MAG: alpha/beta fold hydrolase [Desulfobacterales bacterium]